MIENRQPGSRGARGKRPRNVSDPGGKWYEMDERVLIREILEESKECMSSVYADVIVDITNEKLDRSGSTRFRRN